MFIGKVCGAVVATQKDARLGGAKLLVVEPQVATPHAPGKLTPTGKTLVAIDALGAGRGACVLVTQGSSARLTDVTAQMPVDAVIIGIVETVELNGAGDPGASGGSPPGRDGEA